MQWSGLWRYPTIGYSAGGILYANHPLTGREEANQIDCPINNSHDQYVSVVYKISTDPDIIQQLQAQCLSWYFSDIESYGSDFSKSEAPCPCTLSQALWERRFQEDVTKEDSDCFIQRFPNELGGAQECCYSRSRQTFGALVLQGRSSGGLLRFHPYWPNYNNPNYTEYDRIPQEICCAAGYCRYYHERRPPHNCEGYVPQLRSKYYCIFCSNIHTNNVLVTYAFCYTVAWGRGDPHFTTLDGRTYTFNGLGEYVLLRESSNNFEFQGRTESAPNSNATIFSAFVIKDGSDTVEVCI